jgi:hypothetical protein
MRTRQFVPLALAIGLVIGVSLIGRVANAVIIAETGFNDASGINSDGTANTPYTLGAQLHGNGAVETGWAGAWNQTTTVSATRGSVNTTTVFEGDGAARFESGPGTNSAANTANFNRSMSSTFSTGIFTVDYYFRVEQMTNNRTMVLYSGSNGGTQHSSLIQITHTAADGNFNLGGYHGNGAGGITLIDSNQDLAPNTWYKLTAKLDIDALNWDLLLNDAEVLSDLGFRHNTSAALSWIQANVDRGNNATGGVGQIAYLDAVTISQVPEPSALLISACGVIGATLLLRRTRCSRE